MKTLVVYYSLSGNNRLLAETLAKRLGCEACELHPSKPRTKLDLLLDAFLYRSPPNEPVPYDIGAYERVVLVAPVWNARIAAPMRAFARKSGGHLGNYAFVTACAGRANQGARLHRELTRYIGRGPRQLVELEARQFLPMLMRLGRGASTYRWTERDIEALSPQLDRFIDAIGGSDAVRDDLAPNIRHFPLHRRYQDRGSHA